MAKKKIDRTALRFSIRIAGSVTSLSLRRNLVALWLTLNLEDISEYNDGVKGSVNGITLNFIYKCLGKWKQNTGKGFSDFVSEQMIQDILDVEDFTKYREILALI